MASYAHGGACHVALHVTFPREWVSVLQFSRRLSCVTSILPLLLSRFCISPIEYMLIKKRLEGAVMETARIFQSTCR